MTVKNTILDISKTEATFGWNWPPRSPLNLIKFDEAMTRLVHKVRDSKTLVSIVVTTTGEY
jgi:hypothetical protein